MNPLRGNLIFTGALVVAAVLFGMVLAGGSEITPTAFTAAGPQRVDLNNPTVTLPNFADLAEAVLPAVASVRVVTIEKGSDRPTSPFQFFFNDPRRQAPPDEEREFRQDGAGSGFLISSDGWMVTNHHVIEGATSVEVTIEERNYPAEVKGKDPSTDLAVLKIEADHDIKYLALGDSEELRVGEWVMAIGNPQGLSQSVTVGVVSAKGRSIGLARDISFENYIQTDAAINQGNSGGPLVNQRGEVVGISTAMNYGAENIAFAVPVDTLKSVVDQLQSEGRVRRGYLGVNITNLDERTAEAFGVDSTNGALVSNVSPGGPAESAGLRNGDIIVKVDDHRVVDTRDLIDYVAGKAPGTRVKVEFVRNGRSLDSQILLGERDSVNEVAAIADPEEVELEWLGLQYQDITPGLRENHGLDDDIEGVIVTDIAVSSPLIDEGVIPGDIITEINGEPVESSGEFSEIVGGKESGTLLRLYLRRLGGNRDVGFFAIVRVP